MTDRFRGQRIAVVMGGLSAEREVSLKTGAGVLAALQERGHDAVAIDWRPGTSLPALLAEAGAQVVWNALHGTFGEDGAVQGLCACLGLPCTGSGILASALAMDKVASKRLFESHGIPTPRWQVLPGAGDGPADGGDAPTALAGWAFPLVVKPADEGSSVGVSIVDDAAQLAPAVALARTLHGPVLVEEYIAGTEIFTGILDDAILGSVEVRPATRFYDYDAKYLRADTRYLLPPELPPEVVARAEAHALAAHRALGCSGHSRPDLRIDRDGQAWVLEVNTLPGMTATSLLPKIAARAGLPYATLCERILASAR
ncbi:MAG: D-alanine--D-alanine ligase [Kofleriaceae bacterium]|nr:D-alanine--D-alanine ligase [Kofleriaceae bacterium]MCL4228010.1 D-alanine--D-alanine ligase [Myxococcales bacterium]